MSKERRGEIAEAFLRYVLAKKGGISIQPNETRRELGSAAKAIGVPVDELRQFVRSIVEEFVDEAFSESSS